MGYCRPLATSILQIVMESMVTIDIKIVVEIEDLDDDETEKIMADVAQQQAEIAAQGDEDIVGLENGVTQDDDDDIDEDDPEQALRIIKDHMLKLDGMISLLFQHLDRELSSGSPEQNSITFDQIVSIFRRSVLTTHNSRHTQYLLFRFTQLYPDLYTRFMKSLGSVAFDRNRSIAIRISAISYLASFAARGSKVTRDDVRAIFDMLCREMERLRAGYDLANYGPDPDRFRFYYAMFQACMYIFCFRWRDFSLEPEDVDEHPILDDTEELKWSPEIKEAFTRHIYCSVNPLKACSPLIVEMFAKVTKALNFLYLYSILETNKRVRLLRSVMSSAIRESALSKSQSEASLQLEAHYAFEPYLLPSSKHWVDDLYQDFDSLAPPGMEPDDSSDDDAPENEAEFGEEGTATDEE
jgi:RNA polymerase I-specific transcription initiation factor RRN3